MEKHREKKAANQRGEKLRSPTQTKKNLKRKDKNHPESRRKWMVGKGRRIESNLEKIAR